MLYTRPNASSLHRKTFEFLRRTFPLYPIEQEHKIRYEGKTLFFDFFIGEIGVAVECQGVQHTRWVPFFQDTPFDFVQQKRRDAMKEAWCKENEVSLVCVYSEAELTSEIFWEKVHDFLFKE